MNPYKLLFGLFIAALDGLCIWILYSIVNYLLTGAATGNLAMVLVGGIGLWFGGGLSVLGIIIFSLLLFMLVLDS